MFASLAPDRTCPSVLVNRAISNPALSVAPGGGNATPPIGRPQEHAAQGPFLGLRYSWFRKSVRKLAYILCGSDLTTSIFCGRVKGVSPGRVRGEGKMLGGRTYGENKRVTARHRMRTVSGRQEPVQEGLRRATDRYLIGKIRPHQPLTNRYPPPPNPPKPRGYLESVDYVILGLCQSQEVACNQ